MIGEKSNDTPTNVAERFPDDFLIGASTAAYQVEGARIFHSFTLDCFL